MLDHEVTLGRIPPVRARLRPGRRRSRPAGHRPRLVPGLHLRRLAGRPAAFRGRMGICRAGRLPPACWPAGRSSSTARPGGSATRSTPKEAICGSTRCAARRAIPGGSTTSSATPGNGPPTGTGPTRTRPQVDPAGPPGNPNRARIFRSTQPCATYRAWSAGRVHHRIHGLPGGVAGSATWKPMTRPFRSAAAASAYGGFAGGGPRRTEPPRITRQAPLGGPQPSGSGRVPAGAAALAVHSKTLPSTS